MNDRHIHTTSIKRSGKWIRFFVQITKLGKQRQTTNKKQISELNEKKERKIIAKRQNNSGRKTVNMKIVLNKNEFNEKANKMFVYFVKAFILHIYFCAALKMEKQIRCRRMQKRPEQASLFEYLESYYTRFDIYYEKKTWICRMEKIMKKENCIFFCCIKKHRFVYFQNGFIDSNTQLHI